MSAPLIGICVVLLAWWLSTGLILWRVRVADNMGARAHELSVAASIPLLMFGVWGTLVTRGETSPAYAYLGFVSALALWGWVELAFLSGVITGPNRTASPAGLTLPARFGRAVMAILWHEAALLLLAVWLIWAQWGAENWLAAATFALLLMARSLAKVNLFLGVPRINLQFVPRAIAPITSHFRTAPAGGFYALSVALLAAIFGLLAQRAMGAADSSALSYTILATLAGLALLEHLFMVLPLPDAKLWAWMLPKAKPKITTLKE